MTKEKPIPGAYGARSRAADTGQRVYEALRQKAIDYTLRPGERVNEVRLASELDVSRTPVRAGLNRLVSEGFLKLVPNKGFYRPAIDIETIRSLFEMRSAIELLSVRLFCERAGDDQIDALEHLATVFQRADDTLSVPQIVDEDERFHESIAHGSRNSEAARLLSDMNSRMRFLRLVALERQNCNQVTGEDHARIARAIRTRDSAQAVALMREHIDLMLNDVTEIAREAEVRIYLGAGASESVYNTVS